MSAGEPLDAFYMSEPFRLQQADMLVMLKFRRVFRKFENQRFGRLCAGRNTAGTPTLSPQIYMHKCIRVRYLSIIRREGGKSYGVRVVKLDPAAGRERAAAL